MKKLLKVAAIFATIAILSVSCKNEESTPAAPENEISVSNYSNGKIIKNNVVSVNVSKDSYVEYLQFTSEKGGNYIVYLNGSKITKFDGSAIPETFTYDSATGKFSAGNVSSYMFNAKKDGNAVSAFSKGRLSPADSSKGLYTEWTSENFPKVTFSVDADKNEFVEIVSGEQSFSPSFTNEKGWITVDGVDNDLVLFHSSNNFLFYQVYITERSEVSEVGRSLNSNSIEEFNSTEFLLLN